MSKVKLTIGVSGLNNIDNPGPGVPVIRALREAKDFDVRIIGLAYENLEPGAYMPGIADKIYKLPYPTEGIDQLLNRMDYIQKKEQLDVIIPNFDAELFSFMKAEQSLKEMGIRTFLPTIQQFEERQKSNLPDFGKKYNVNVPESKAIIDYSQIKELSEKVTFPVMVKGKYYDAYIANNEQQMQMYFDKLSSKWGLPVIVQEYITGTEVNVVALGDGNGNTVSAVPMRKQYITDKGKAWGGITLDDHTMLDLTYSIISQTNWRGGMELELIRTQSNELYLIEINPRIPAWVYLAVGAGQNLPEALVKLALGQKVEPMTDYAIGKMFIRYSYDLITDLDEFAELAVYNEK